jgi:uncharacterized integral membrane protein
VNSVRKNFYNGRLSNGVKKDTMFIIVLVLVIIIVVSIFAFQNSVPVTLSFFFWRFEASLAVVIFISAVTGLIAGIIIGILVRSKSSAKK